jgi:cytosine/adenosine deaminase-related metal-dependent hydrolase
MLRAGIVPALGTDSLASNLSLDLLAEAKALGDRFPNVPKSTLLRMATSAGASALGRDDLGRLAKGLRPGVIAVRGELGPTDDPAAFVLGRPSAARVWVDERRPLTGIAPAERLTPSLSSARGLP